MIPLILALVSASFTLSGESPPHLDTIMVIFGVKVVAKDFLSNRQMTKLITMNKDSCSTTILIVPEFNSIQLLQTKIWFSLYRLLPPPTQRPFKVSAWSLLINQATFLEAFLLSIVFC